MCWTAPTPSSSSHWIVGAHTHTHTHTHKHTHTHTHTHTQGYPRGAVGHAEARFQLQVRVATETCAQDRRESTALAPLGSAQICVFVSVFVCLCVCVCVCVCVSVYDVGLRVQGLQTWWAARIHSRLLIHRRRGRRCALTCRAPRPRVCGLLLSWSPLETRCDLSDHFRHHLYIWRLCVRYTVLRVLTEQQNVHVSILNWQNHICERLWQFRPKAPPLKRVRIGWWCCCRPLSVW